MVKKSLKPITCAFLEAGKPPQFQDIVEDENFNKVIQNFVGGFYEPLRLRKDLTLLVADNGLNMRLPPNELATQVFRKHCAERFREFTIVGNAVVIGDSTKQHFTGIPDDERSRLENVSLIPY